MTGTQGRNWSSAQLPDTIAELQRQAEALYLSRLTLKQEVIELRATQPVMISRPPRPMLLTRICLRANSRLRRRYQLNVIRQSGLFNADWYLTTYEDVRDAGLDPALHYLLNGAADHRNPGPHFDTGHYLMLYPDIGESQMNPLLHYLLSGFDEKRSIRPGMPHEGL